MPNLNFSLPLGQLSPLRDEFLALPDSDRLGALQRLVSAWANCAADAQEQSLWRLEPEALWLPSHVEARKQQALARVEQMIRDAQKQNATDAGGSKAPLPKPSELELQSIVTPRASSAVEDAASRRWPQHGSRQRRSAL